VGRVRGGGVAERGWSEGLAWVSGHCCCLRGVDFGVGLVCLDKDARFWMR
jgi:hypothetical protein